MGGLAEGRGEPWYRPLFESRENEIAARDAAKFPRQRQEHFRIDVGERHVKRSIRNGPRRADKELSAGSGVARNGRIGELDITAAGPARAELSRGMRQQPGATTDIENRIARSKERIERGQRQARPRMLPRAASHARAIVETNPPGGRSLIEPWGREPKPRADVARKPPGLEFGLPVALGRRQRSTEGLRGSGGVEPGFERAIVVLEDAERAGVLEFGEMEVPLVRGRGEANGDQER